MENQSLMMIDLKDNERIDDLQRNGYKIIQNEKKFCFGMDAVLLSGFAMVKEGESLLDIGTGTGIIPILLEAKSKGQHFTGLEIQEESADMAKRSIKLNGLEEKIDIICGDINDAPALFQGTSFDVVTTNPPYMIGKHGLTGDNMEKAIARHEIYCTLEDIVREASSLLKDKGRFYMVHRPFRMVEIFALLTKYRLEPKRLKLVYPFVDKEPNMVLIEALKGGNPRLTVEKPLIVYKEPGVYMDEIYDIYGY
jgi:tRNA1(Val) A37 N6-methylase TrmN6